MFNFQVKMEKINKTQKMFGVTIARVIGGCQMKEAI